MKHVIDGEAALKSNSVSLSNNNAIQRHITELCTDINEQVSTEVQSAKYGFAIQRRNNRTNVSNCAQLLEEPLCYANKDSIRSELLLSNELRTTTRGENLFELVDNFKKKKVFNGAS